MRVQMQDSIMPTVPRPSGSETNPRVVLLGIGEHDTLMEKPTCVIRIVNMGVSGEEKTLGEGRLLAEHMSGRH